MSDQRERRRAAAQAGKSSLDLVALAKRFWIPVAILVIASTVTAVQVNSQGESESCNSDAVHWHAMYSVHIDGQRLSFDPARPHQQSFGSATLPPGVGFHIHGDNNRLHFHPSAPKCIPLGEALEKLGITFVNGALVVDENLHPAFGGTYASNATHTLTVARESWDYVGKEHSGSWRTIGNIDAFLDKMPGNGDRIVINYGAEDTADVPGQQETIGFIGDSYVPQGKTIFVPVMMTWIFAVGGLYVWTRMRGISS